MNSSERIMVLEKLSGIIKSTNQLLAGPCVVDIDRADAELLEIYDAAIELQNRICNQAVVDGYLNDALEQATRVRDLIVESGRAPDERQLASIGYANEITGLKIKEYQRVADFNDQLQALNHPAVEEA